jgi:hypothetical protein
MYEEMLRSEEITRQEVRLLKEFTPYFLDHFSRTVNRVEGMGCNFVKFHFPLHIPDDILRNGVCQNTSSGPGESGHKAKCKQPSKLTQRVYDKFEYQTAIRCTDHIVIDRAQAEIVCRDSISKTNPRTLNGEDGSDVNINYCGRTYVCNDSGIFSTYHNQSKREISEWMDLELQASIHALIREHILPNVHGNEVSLLTQCKRNGIIFRAHPCYKGKTAWQDWAYIDWEDAGLIPAQMLIFVDLTNLKQPFVLHENPIDVPGIYAIAHSLVECLDNKPHYLKECEDGNYRAHQSSELLLFAHKELVDGHVQPHDEITEGRKPKANNAKQEVPEHMPQAKLYIISCDAIESQCIAIPDVGSKKYQGYFFLRSRDSWRNIFFELMKEKMEVDEL